MSINERFEGLSEAERVTLLRGLTDVERDAWLANWPEWAHPGQLWPGGAWRTWVMMAGRGFGKTRAGAEWVAALVRACGSGGQAQGGGGGGGPFWQGAQGAAGGLDPGVAGPIRIALVAATTDEARRIMVEGPSGLLSLAWPPGARPSFEPSRRRLLWPCGSEATLFSGASPEALRGPEHHFAWCDELAKWRHPGETWDMLQFGLRMGARPRTLVTTTPRAGCTTLRAILQAEGTVQTGGPGKRNPPPPGARVGAGQAALIEASRGRAPADAALVRVVIGVDPPASAQGVCGIVACGLDRAGIAHVLADRSAGGLSPEGWARRVAAAAAEHRADRVIAEQNQGGDMVRAVLASADVTLPVRLVRATHGKVARAEPVAALFETGKARFAGHFPALEAELAGLVAGGGYEGPGRSPDRADAMVWALHALVLAAAPSPGVQWL